jgi:uncharacterized membrane protein
VDDSNGNDSSELEKPPLDAVRPPGQEERQRVVAAFQAQLFSGPLPHPSVLQQYQDVFPDCAQRIVAMAEGQSSHRQNLETKKLEGDQQAELLGQVGATIITLSAIGMSAWLAYLGHPIKGIATLLASITALGGVFVYGKKVQSTELREKMEKVDDPQLEMFPEDENEPKR